MGTGIRRPGQGVSYLLDEPAVRLGLWVGLSLSLIFTTWLLVANRVPLLQAVAVPRNVAAASLMAIAGAVPIFRFFRSPAELLLSSVLGWVVFSLTYGALCLKFALLDQYYTTSQVFVLGALVYVLLATLCWIGTIIWRVRATDSSHSRH